MCSELLPEGPGFHLDLLPLLPSLAPGRSGGFHGSSACRALLSWGRCAPCLCPGVRGDIRAGTGGKSGANTCGHTPGTPPGRAYGCCSSRSPSVPAPQLCSVNAARLVFKLPSPPAAAELTLLQGQAAVGAGRGASRAVLPAVRVSVHACSSDRLCRVWREPAQSQLHSRSQTFMGHHGPRLCPVVWPWSHTDA